MTPPSGAEPMTFKDRVLMEEDPFALVEESLVRASLWREVRDRLDSPGGALSGGQQQRLCIARSLAVQPSTNAASSLASRRASSP